MVGEQTKEGFSLIKKKYAMPCGVDMSNKSLSGVMFPNTSNKKASLSLSKQMGVGFCVGNGVRVGAGSVGPKVGRRVGCDGGRVMIGCDVTTGCSVGFSLGDADGDVGAGETVGAVGSSEGEPVGDVGTGESVGGSGASVGA